MSEAQKVVFLKQSGETLSNGEAGGLWKPEGVRTAADKIARAHKLRGTCGVDGLVVVSGAGNIVRGELLKKHRIGGSYADAVGRMATIQNTLILAQALSDLGVGTSTLLSSNMVYGDSAVPDLNPYTVRRVKAAHAENKITLIAGGTGEDNVTTDHAVVHYAADYRKTNKDVEILILKGTKVDGVYEGDPMTNAEVDRYSQIGAPEMLDDHAKYGVVDKPSLQALIDHGLDMRVYNDSVHDLATVMQLERGDMNGLTIGSLITHRQIEKVVAS